MLSLHKNGGFYSGGKWTAAASVPTHAARSKTMSNAILQAHNEAQGGKNLRLRFDSLISHDITYVGIIQTAKASGLDHFPVPYAMTNCHNSLCSVGGTINADDHAFGLSAARRYGGIFVPPSMAVLHQFAREEMAGCGKMILGSDSHTRYGALGCMGIGEGGPELVKQLLGDTYDVFMPQTVLVYVTGAPRHGVGPHDVAIALCGAVYENGFVQNKIMEFAGPGIKSLPMDFRIGIDVMTTEMACLSSIWETDETVSKFYRVHNRAADFAPLAPGDGAFYDGIIELDLSLIEPMIALPFHPSNAYTIREFSTNAADILRGIEREAFETFGGKASLNLTSKLQGGKFMTDQGIIAGCAGGLYDNISEALAILDGAGCADGYFSLNVYPASVPVSMELMSAKITERLTAQGAIFKPCFCGPCFGAGDVPANNAFSIRHATRNFPNREGSKPADGQLAAAALMDARSIAASAARGGILTSAADIDYRAPSQGERHYDNAAYKKRVYQGFGSADPGAELRLGPNITEWPSIPPLADNLLINLASVIRDAVTTTDELIPSGDTSSYRSNPLKLASFTLSRRDPEYVGRAEKIRAAEAARAAGAADGEIKRIWAALGNDDAALSSCSIGSAIFANRPGDGSAREQAASCQRVLGGCANICYEYSTKRYRSNCINWGILPFNLDEGADFPFEPGDFIYVPNVRRAVSEGLCEISARAVKNGVVSDILLHLPPLTEREREIILDGCLMNWYAAQKGRLR